MYISDFKIFLTQRNSTIWKKRHMSVILKKSKSQIPMQSLIAVYPKISHDNVQIFQGKQGNVL